MTEKQAEGLDDHGVEFLLWLNTVHGELPHMLAENARLRDERDAATKQFDDVMIAKLVTDVAHLQNEGSPPKRQLEEPLGLQTRVC